MRSEPGDDLGFGGPIVTLQPAAERVHQNLLGKAPDERVTVTFEKRLQLSWRLEGSAIRQGAGGVHGKFAVLGSPSPDGVEVLESEAERVHPRMAGGANRILPMLFHLL